MKKYFITKGSGQSNMTSEKNETTCYDDALVNAGIGDINVITLSSMIPPDSVEINYVPLGWGEVIHCIMARKDGKKGSFISCALLTAEVYKNQKLLGSFVLEYSGNGSEGIAQKILLKQLLEMIQRRKYGKVNSLSMYSPTVTENNYTILPKHFIYQNLKIKKRYGTVICSICFI